MPSRGFRRLEERVTREYEREGVSPAKARYIGRATAAKVAREKGGDRVASTEEKIYRKLRDKGWSESSAKRSARALSRHAGKRAHRRRRRAKK